jgi:HTH-type transcriptional regulator/antitoxin HigA
MAANASRRAVGDAYLALIHRFPLRPLRSGADLGAAIAVVDSLVSRDTLAQDEQDYLDVISRLIEDYEDTHDPLPELSGVEALRFLIEENRMSQSQLSRETGLPVTTLSEILNGRRGISPRVRTALAKRFKVGPELFL